VRRPEEASHEWVAYHNVVRLHAPPSLETAWEKEAETLTLLVSASAFDGGGERNVFHAHFEGSGFQWVAKESRHIDPGGYEAEVEFHKRSLVTQSTCAAWAADFNQQVDVMGLSIPAVEVNRCYLVVVDARPLFVEPKIHGRFHKWNSNAGLVHKTSLADEQHHHRLQHAHATDETSSESCVPATSDDVNGEVPTVDDVPQCFTHWTYAASRHTRMVCDLQGFFTGGRFVLVDPVIHSDGDGKGSGAFGRTDRGAKGMSDFLRSHECNALCRRLGLSQPTAADVPARRVCVICEDQPREVRFACGHACTCTSCAVLVRNRDNLCPTCRAPLGDLPFKPVGPSMTTFVRPMRTAR